MSLGSVGYRGIVHLHPEPHKQLTANMSAKQNVDVEVSQPADAHLMKETISGPQSNSGSDDGGEQRLQEGVQRIEAITSTWTVKALIITFLWYGRFFHAKSVVDANSQSTAFTSSLLPTRFSIPSLAV